MKQVIQQVWQNLKESLQEHLGQSFTQDVDLISGIENWSLNSLFMTSTDQQELLDLFQGHFQTIEKSIEKKQLAENCLKDLKERFSKDLEFGTGGMRGILGIGASRLNPTNLSRATSALAAYLKDFHSSSLSPLKVAISYDVRYRSKEFADLCSQVLQDLGLEVLLFDDIAPTPLLSFAVRFYNCHAGIMITASHNPPVYNGYKVFWQDGAQVTPPHDQKIIELYANEKLLSEKIRQDQVKIANHPKALEKIIGPEVKKAYVKSTLGITPKYSQNPAKIKAVYSPLHGTGLELAELTINQQSFVDFSIVEIQKSRDPQFSTVKSPNPEEPQALLMASQMMKELGADIAYGTDPDGDRLGLSVIDPENEGDGYFYPNGNQIGLLQCHYLLEQAKKNSPETMHLNYIVQTLVTSPLLEYMAKSYGAHVGYTLTGFKWICGLMNQWEQTYPERHFLFGTEESFGFLHNGNIRDKDGVGAMALMNEVVSYWKSQHKNLKQALEEIYRNFGIWQELLLSLNYEGLAGKTKIQSLMEKVRKNPQELVNSFGDLLSLEMIEDLELGIRTQVSTKQSSQIIEFPQSNVIGLYFADKTRIFLRPSGTEPKIKFYIMCPHPQNFLEKKNPLTSTEVKEYSAWCLQRAQFLRESLKTFCDKA